MGTKLFEHKQTRGMVSVKASTFTPPYRDRLGLFTAEISGPSVENSLVRRANARIDNLFDCGIDLFDHQCVGHRSREQEEIGASTIEPVGRRKNGTIGTVRTSKTITAFIARGYSG